MGKQWEEYEDVARYVINELREKFGFDRIGEKQKVAGASRTVWEIDAKAVMTGDGGFLVIECRRWVNARLSQEDLGGLAYRIKDVGAKGGLIVSPLDLQQGAGIVAQHENIRQLKIDPESTETAYFARYLNAVFVGLTTAQASVVDLGMTVQRAPNSEP